jgi:hypothetical protein
MVAAVVRDLCMGLVAYSVPFIGAAVYFASVRPFMRRIARWVRVCVCVCVCVCVRVNAFLYVDAGVWVVCDYAK